MPKARFFTWYRVAPLAVVFVFGLISLVYSCAPAAFFKPLYPIDYEAYVKQSSISHNLDPYLVCAVIKSESNWDPEAESNQGAQGLMQLMPETAQDMIAKGLVNGEVYSADNLSDPATNIEFAAHTSRIFSPISTGRRIVPSPPITPVWALSTDGRSRTRHSIMRLPSLKLRLI